MYFGTKLLSSLPTQSRPDSEAPVRVRPTMTSIPAAKTESTHHRLFEFAKTALIKIFVSPYATVRALTPSLSLSLTLSIYTISEETVSFSVGFVQVCDLYAGAGADADKWDEAQIGHYIGIGNQRFIFGF